MPTFRTKPEVWIDGVHCTEVSGVEFGPAPPAPASKIRFSVIYNPANDLHRILANTKPETLNLFTITDNKGTAEFHAFTTTRLETIAEGTHRLHVVLEPVPNLETE